MNNATLSESRIKPVQEKSKIAEVKMMQKILCKKCETEENLQEMCYSDVEKCNINRQIIPLVFIADNKQ